MLLATPTSKLAPLFMYAKGFPPSSYAELLPSFTS
ncbi:hypothetical protein AX774_g6559, partial [Zancudomyces culisetae]